MPRPGFDHARYTTTDKHREGFQPYETAFAHLRGQRVDVLELGVDRGGSLLLWRDYFQDGVVVGIDQATPVSIEDPQNRIHVHQARQEDSAALSQIATLRAPGGFDLIIDDASHLADPTRTSFWHLFEHHLKPGGLYVIEDWGTGYFADWPDGARYVPGSNHVAGMVGFVKELIDEMGSADRGRERTGGPVGRATRFADVRVTEYIVFVTKRRHR